MFCALALVMSEFLIQMTVIPPSLPPLTGLQQENNLKIRVEPGLFEWTKWVSGSSLPAWILPVDLAAASLSVDTTYR